jgi:hypothetical protein
MGMSIVSEGTKIDEKTIRYIKIPPNIVNIVGSTFDPLSSLLMFVLVATRVDVGFLCNIVNLLNTSFT